VTSGEDCLIKLWEIPASVPESEADSANIIRDPISILDGSLKRVTFTKFNSVADNVLATACNDGSVMTWDLAQKRVTSKVDCKDMCQSLEWDFFGSSICGTFKDKSLRVIDPRRKGIALESLNSHKGNKASRAVWLSSRNQVSDSGSYIVSCGFAPQAKREVFLWDTRNFKNPVWTNSLDDNSGIIYPFFDECTGLLLLVGKGDGNIRYYEFTDSALYYLNDYRSQSPQRGFCLFPKRVVDQEKSEVLRGLKLESTSIQTMSFLVPRRTEAGSSDLYPLAPNGRAAICSSEDWFKAKDLLMAPAMGDTLSAPAGRIPVPKISLSQIPHTSTSVAPLTNSSRSNVPSEDYKQLKHQLAFANRTIEDQSNKILRLEAIVMSLKEPAVSPSPKHRQTNQQQELVEELRTEVAILKEKVVKLMNENARLRMTFSNGPKSVLATMSSLPVPPPPPITRSPARNIRP